MRAIRFRVFNKQTHQWVHGPGQEPNLFGECILLGYFMHGVGIMELNDCIALQYSGVNDKNKKEIYEGDLLNYNGRIGQVEFISGMFVCSWDDQTDELTYMMTEEMEIIGNIFDK